MESDYTVVIIVTFVGFMALAALLLVPVWRFLRREEQASQRWTPQTMPGAGDARADKEDPEDRVRDQDPTADS